MAGICGAMKIGSHSTFSGTWISVRDVVAADGSPFLGDGARLTHTVWYRKLCELMNQFNAKEICQVAYPSEQLLAPSHEARPGQNRHKLVIILIVNKHSVRGVALSTKLVCFIMLRGSRARDQHHM